MARPKIAGEFASLAELRRAVIEIRGERCELPGCGATRDVQAAHIMAAGQGGHLVIENVMLLCRGHHEDYDQYRSKIDVAWLSPETRVYLAAQGYLWVDQGELHGRGLRRFAL